MPEKQTVLVTGAAGFIGSHLCDALTREGYGVRAADRVPVEDAVNLSQLRSLEYHAVDVADVQTCNRLCVGVDVVLHHAAMASVPASIDDPENSQRDTADTTKALLEAAKANGVRRFVLASTAAVYGDAGDQPAKETTAPRAKSPYATAKVMSEGFVKSFVQMGLDGVILRYFNVYGPRQSATSGYAGVIPSFVNALRKGEEIVVHGDGEQTRDFLHVRDAVRANLLALNHPEPLAGRAINIASGHSVSVNQLVEALANISSVLPNVRHEPEREGDIRQSRADVTLAAELLDMKAEVSLAQGLSELWEEARTE